MMFLLKTVFLVLYSCFLFNLGSPMVASAAANFSFSDTFDVKCADNGFSTSQDGQTWYIALNKDAGCGFSTKNKYRFGWFSMKIQLVGGDSAGVVTAYYMVSDTGPHRDELDFEFLGNRTGQPYLLQTNIYHDGKGDREMRHYLWFDPTKDFHSYSILWNAHQIVFFVDRVPIRVLRNSEASKSAFPVDKPMYLLSSIWNADDWATRGGLEKTDWKNAPFVSSYKDFQVEACEWSDPSPPCVATTTQNWWDQSESWSVSDTQQVDFSWVRRNLEDYNYCTDTKRYENNMPPECSDYNMS